MTDDSGKRRRGHAVANAIGIFLAILAMGLALVALQQITGNRRDAARDSCHLLRGLVFAATTSAPRQRAAAAAYIHRTPLYNCNAYARAIVK